MLMHDSENILSEGSTVKRRILGITLALAIIAAILPLTATPIAQAAPSKTTLNAAYKAYYDVLRTAIKEAEESDWVDMIVGGDRSYEIAGAKLFDFDNDGLPELLFYTQFNGSHDDNDCAIYGYSAGVQLYGVYGNNSSLDGYTSFRIVTDRNGVSYLHYAGVTLNHTVDNNGNIIDTEEADREDSYFTVKGGKWVEVPEKGIDIVKEQDLSWLKTSSTVGATLAELQSLQPPPPQDATPSAWSLNVNGGALRGTDMYSIGGNNYLKIRDIAALLNGTEKQFNISVDGTTVNLISGAVYVARGDEMTPNPNATKTMTSETTYSFTLDGKQIELTAYMIAGSNYIRIRDILHLFDVFVGYNSSLREFYIDTSKKYEDN